MEQAMAQGEVPTVAGGRGARTGVKDARDPGSRSRSFALSGKTHNQSTTGPVETLET